MKRILSVPFHRIGNSLIKRDINVNFNPIVFSFNKPKPLILFCNLVNYSCWNCKAVYKPFNYFCPECSKIQKPSASVTYFELFGIPCSFEINLENLTKEFRAIQALLHPDKYSQKDEYEQNLSSEYSSLINKAYSSLFNPLQRALYMLQLKEITIAEENTQMDQLFLMEVMELNEEIDGANSNKLSKIEKLNQERIKKLFAEFSKFYEESNFGKAKDLVIKIKYFVSVEKRLKDIKMKSLE